MINKFPMVLDGLYDRLHQRGLMLFSLVLAVVCAGGVIWDPVDFSSKIGGFNAVNGPALIWATCAGFIHGMAFKPYYWLWQVVFFPPLAWLVMLSILAVRFF